eukprot:CAMPEP_0170175476 /NCGR_PEP_ID=MMETSP0040_2-20121228/8548_1 /TAXON_ID=641309 /ORGANISM="Lotharella oceanica, Strain CCMP622" /LENGTH=30 /DNA_ID= /DNA_START= /DNA_END= /DNA_ORIENTATION=
MDLNSKRAEWTERAMEDMRGWVVRNVAQQN